MYRACPNEETCGGELEFDWEQSDSGDGVWAMSWTYAVLVNQTCKCELSPETIARLEQEVTQDGPPEPDYDY